MRDPVGLRRVVIEPEARHQTSWLLGRGRQLLRLGAYLLDLRAHFFGSLDRSRDVAQCGGRGLEDREVPSVDEAYQRTPNTAGTTIVVEQCLVEPCAHRRPFFDARFDAELRASPGHGGAMCATAAQNRSSQTQAGASKRTLEKVTGRLQNGRSGSFLFEGGFDSHAPTPSIPNSK
jgi:hypothetical protein